jgi:predicted deacylase
MTIKPFTVGPLKGTPGRLAYHQVEVMALPTGGSEHIPVIVAQGRRRGPCFWITTGIHGPEHTGLNVVHQLLDRALVRALRGTLVVVPALSPAGLRTAARQPYYVREDPNRLFPDGTPAADHTPPSPLELAYARLFEWIRASADYLVDLHNAWIGSVPFIFRDRVWYRGEDERPAAERLLAKTDELIAALGLSVVNEFPIDRYLEHKLHRSVSGATLNVARIPAVTIELGTGMTPDPAIVQAGLAALRNALRWAGLLDDEPEAISSVQVIHPAFAVRREMSPRVPVSCIVRHVVRPGDLLRVGDAVAELSDICGRPVAGGVLPSEHDGWVMGLAEGVVRYQGDAVLHMAIRDEAPQLVPYPEQARAAAARPAPSAEKRAAEKRAAEKRAAEKRAAEKRAARRRATGRKP